MPPEFKLKVIAMSAKNVSPKEIARRMGTTLEVVENILAEPYDIW
jgi:transposase-like protein